MAHRKAIFFSGCFGVFVLANLLLMFISTPEKKAALLGRTALARSRRSTDNFTAAENHNGSTFTTSSPNNRNSSNSNSDHSSNEAGSSEGHHHAKTHHSERFQVISVNWPRVSDPFIISIWIVVAGLAKIFFHYMNKVLSRVPESCLLICLGLIVGGVAFAVNRKHRIEELLFNPDTFFLIILPPIVMEAGYFMPKDPFLDNLGSILLYAIVGTIFNAMAIGFSLYGAFLVNWMPGMKGLSMLDCLLFGSIISAVDPVAVISVFEEIHVNTVLYICVFGESLLNDGVAVVLFHMFEGYIEIDNEGELLPIDYVAAVASFFVVALGGLLIGIIFGYLCSFITKFTHHNRIVEPTFIFVMCYLAYLTAEIFHLSGIIAIVFAGFTMNSYVEHNISAKSHTTVKYGMKMMANVCETIIFMLLGIAAVSDFWQYWNTAFVLWTLLFITVYRAIGVVVLTGILNYFRLDKINSVDQFVMAYGGLRGAIAFSLVSLTSPTLVPNIKTMVCACIVCIFFTSFVQGSTIRPIVEFLHVKTTRSHKLTMMEDVNLRLIEHLMAGVEDIIGHRGHHYWEQKWNRFNSEYLMKWFVREPYQSHDAEILETFHRINKREAASLIQDIGKGGSFANGMQSEKTLANLLLASDIRRSGSHASLGYMLKTNNSSEVCLDLRAIDAKAPVTGTTTDAHHMLKANMYKPRNVDMSYRRGELPSDSTRKRQEQEILIRRKIHQRKRKHHRKHKKHGSSKASHMNEYSKHDKRPYNGPIEDDEQIHLLTGHMVDPQTGLSVPEITLNMVETNYHHHEEDEMGITFSAEKQEEPVDEVDANEPSCSKELPWKTKNQFAAVMDPSSKANLEELDSSEAKTFYRQSRADNTNENNNSDNIEMIETIPLTHTEERSNKNVCLIDLKEWETIEEDDV